MVVVRPRCRLVMPAGYGASEVTPSNDAIASLHQFIRQRDSLAMRTTLDIDPEILNVVKERARRERRSAGAVLSELARQALTGAGAPQADEETVPCHGFRPFPKASRVVSEATVERLRDELGV